MGKKEITDIGAVEAYEKLWEYCSERECENCLFDDEEDGECGLASGEPPCFQEKARYRRKARGRKEERK